MIESWHLPLLFATGLAAGFVDSIAGGGGLITLPVLLSLGIQPQVALGTNKLQATFGSCSAAVHFVRAGTVSVRECARGFSLSFTGAALGALAVMQVSPTFLRQLIPVLLAIVAIYVLVKPNFGNERRPARMSHAVFDVLFGLGIGFYDGFFGPGTGTFWAMACILCLGYDLTRATGYTKAMNFASNLSSLLFFLAAGKVLFLPGLVMGLGQWLGARLGAGMVVTRGTRFIRPVFLTMVLLLTLKLAWDAWR